MLRTIIFIGMLLTSCGQNSSNADLSGYSGKATKFVGESFLLFPDTPSQSDLERFIRKSNLQIDATKLAKDIKSVATCFAIDERILASQMRQESNFNPGAESPTHAVGLMQLTGLGIQEIEDQLGARGTLYASSTAITYFNKVRTTCLKKSLGWDSADDMLLWKRVPTGNRQSILATKKSLIKSEPRIGLAYGAIMIKTLLSKAKSEDASRDIENTFRRSLWLYNGDPAEQEHYQNVILERAQGI